MMTLEKLASPQNVERVVGPRPIPRWNNSSTTLVRSDGHSRESWFGRHPPKKRVKLVREFLLDGGQWETLQRHQIPKVGKPGHRNIDVPTVLGQAAQYVIDAWFRGTVERRLNKWCLAYRPHQKFHVNAKRVLKCLGHRPWAQQFDVVDYFGSIRHQRLDSLVGSLGADDALQDVLSRLWRVAVIDRRGRPVRRPQGRGIAQGLILSPAASNLYASDVWVGINEQASTRSATVAHYCDDGLTMATSMAAAEETTDIARDMLETIGLKTTVDASTDVRDPGLDWLGLVFIHDAIDVSDEKLALKVSTWSRRAAQGLISREGAEESMKGFLAHYRRLVSPSRLSTIQRQMEEGLSAISFPPPGGREEELFLQSLAG